MVKTAEHRSASGIATNRTDKPFFEKGGNDFFNVDVIPFFKPEKYAGKQLPAHELAHVTEHASHIQPYRDKKSFNFGKADDAGAGLIEDSFNFKKDKDSKPWIEKITIKLTGKKKDTDGNNMWTGNATAKYYDNPFKLPDLNLSISAGSREVGITDKGSFKVHRIEGVGYNSGSFSGTPGRDFKLSEREGPKKRYSKDLNSNMSFAVFYHKGEAIHSGPADLSSHGCVHVDWSDDTAIKQLNYHSVIGHTRVEVSYP